MTTRTPAFARSLALEVAVAQPAQPPRLDSEGGPEASATVASLADGGGAIAAIAQSGHASRTRRVASSAFARAEVHGSPGSSAQMRSATRRIEPSARHAEVQSAVESATCSSARLFGSVASSSPAGCAWAGEQSPRTIAGIARPRSDHLRYAVCIHPR